MKKNILTLFALAVWICSFSYAQSLETMISLVNAEIQKENYADYSVTASKELAQAIQWMFNSWLTKFSTVETYEPNTHLTREAAAKFFGVYATTILWKRESDAFMCDFTDQSTANPWLLINIIQSCRLWLFKWANGKFLPKEELTNAQAITVAIKALYGEQPSNPNGHWAQPFFDKASKEGLLDWLMLGEKTNLDMPALRGEIAIMLYRAINQ